MGVSSSSELAAHKSFVRQQAAAAAAAAAGAADSQTGQVYRVYIHRRKKFFPAYLHVSPCAITLKLERSRVEKIVWPLQLLRRYGYTSAGVFFFESGRRCSTGEGLHTFQSSEAEKIFLDVQMRIQDTANSVQERQERARSTGAASVLSTSMTMEGSTSSVPPPHTDYANAGLEHLSGQQRIHPLQRYSSEGSGGDYLTQPSGYNSFHHPPPPRARRVIIPPPPRPRSLGGEDEHGAMRLPPDSYHPASGTRSTTGYSDNIFAGNIISESRIRSDSETSVPHALSGLKPRGGSVGAVDARHSYANFTPPTGHRPLNSLAGSNSSIPTTPATPTRTVFPIKWDGGAGSTSLLCYANTVPMMGQQQQQHSSTDQYINLNPVHGLSDEHSRQLQQQMMMTMPQLNYAALDILAGAGGGCDGGERVPSRCSSIGHRSSDSAPLAACDEDEDTNISYSHIDPIRTQALREANERANDDRRRGFRRRQAD